MVIEWSSDLSLTGTLFALLYYNHNSSSQLMTCYFSKFFFRFIFGFFFVIFFRVFVCLVFLRILILLFLMIFIGEKNVCFAVVKIWNLVNNQSPDVRAFCSSKWFVWMWFWFCFWFWRAGNIGLKIKYELILELNLKIVNIFNLYLYSLIEAFW